MDAAAIEQEARDEIKDAIAWYEARGFDWLSVVGFIACRALDILPQDVARRVAQKRTVR